MRLTLGTKLWAISATAALGFAFLMVQGHLLSLRMAERLGTFQTFYLPRVELAPTLTFDFEQLRRGLQDAVGARDLELLEAAGSAERAFLTHLEQAGAAVEPSAAQALRDGFVDYARRARSVSRRLIDQEAGEAISDGIAELHEKQARVELLLQQATSVDRGALARAFAAAQEEQAGAARIRLLTTAAFLVTVSLFSLAVARGIRRSLALLTEGLGRVGGGDFRQPIPVHGNDELAEVGRHANQMADKLRRLGEERARADWLKEGQAGLLHVLRGELEPEEVAGRALRHLAGYLELPAGALYSVERDGELRRLAQQGLTDAAAPGSEMRHRVGEGLLGEVARHGSVRILRGAEAEPLRLRSGLGEWAPQALVLQPLRRGGEVTAVLELVTLRPWEERATELLESVGETLAIALEVARARAATRALLAETQRQAAQLGEQEEELRARNEELQAQQEELRRNNEELTEQATELDAQRRSLEATNAELVAAKHLLEEKAKELATVSSYKSQFLANMSHELRTPLNSLLLLSNLLAENEGGTLSPKQVEHARTITAAGRELLALINQVLDLSKVESGKQEVHVQKVSLAQVVRRCQRVFEPLAKDKGLAFDVTVAPGLPEVIQTDPQRLEQILTNLLGNAIKFTAQGSVRLEIARPPPHLSLGPGLPPERTVAFRVSDTGLGIAPEHHEHVFAPFEQVDGAANRRYGGTGLGLTISRELARLLEGDLSLESALARGSTFTCLLPEVPQRRSEPAAASAPGAPRASGEAPAPLRPVPVSPVPSWEVELARLSPGEPYLLVLEDDRSFAEAFRGIIQERGRHCVVVPDGRAGLALAQRRRPAGIILDVRLPGVDGWSVMEELRRRPETASIPVHFVSALDAAERGLALGAIGYLTKPATRQQLVEVIEALLPKRTQGGLPVLVVEGAESPDSVLALLEGEQLAFRRVTHGQEALDLLARERFGCLVLDLSLPDMDGLSFLEALQRAEGAEMPPVLVYTGRALSQDEAKQLEAYAEAVVLKEGASSERLLSEIRMFLRRLEEGQPRRSAPPPLPADDGRLRGRRVLLVDDDMRSVYALSAMLRTKGVEVLTAENGLAALQVLERHPDVEVGLMDIMMPEMDGYEAMRRIRRDPRFAQLPLLALTAKAMKGDAERCIEAGANGYVSKPIDPVRLLSTLRAHLPAGEGDAA